MGRDNIFVVPDKKIAGRVKRLIFYRKRMRMFLQHILESIERVEGYTQDNSKEDFMENLWSRSGS